MSVTGTLGGYGGVLPKRARDVKGVSTGSLIDLKAALYEEEESVKRQKLGRPDERKDRVKRQRGRLDAKFGDRHAAPNAGVAERDARDAAERAAESRGQESVTDALLRKAELYEQMQAGGNGASADSSVDGGKYLIDFFVKSGDHGPSPAERAAGPRNDHTPWAGDGGSRGVAQLSMVTADMRQEAERQDWESDAGSVGAQEDGRRANVDMLKQLTADTASARRKKTDVKAARAAAKLARQAKVAARQQKRAGGVAGLGAAAAEGGAAGATAGSAGGDTSALATLLTEEERRKEEEVRAVLAADRSADLKAQAERREAEAKAAAETEAAAKVAEAAEKAAEAAQWEALRDPTGKMYFHHRGRKHTQWECPVGIKLEAPPPRLPRPPSPTAVQPQQPQWGPVAGYDPQALLQQQQQQAVYQQQMQGPYAAHWQAYYANQQHQPQHQPQPQPQPQPQQPQPPPQSTADAFLSSMTHGGAGPAAVATTRNAAPMVAGAGRGRDMTRPAWMTKG